MDQVSFFFQLLFKHAKVFDKLLSIKIFFHVMLLRCKNYFKRYSNFCFHPRGNILIACNNNNRLVLVAANIILFRIHDKYSNILLNYLRTRSRGNLLCILISVPRVINHNKESMKEYKS